MVCSFELTRKEDNAGFGDKTQFAMVGAFGAKNLRCDELVEGAGYETGRTEGGRMGREVGTQAKLLHRTSARGGDGG